MIPPRGATVVRVEDFRLNGTEVRTDSATWQAAADSLKKVGTSTSRASTILLAERVEYIFTGRILIPAVANLTIAGLGMHQTVIRPGGSNFPAFVVNAKTIEGVLDLPDSDARRQVTNLSFRDFTVDCGITAQTQPPTIASQDDDLQAFILRDCLPGTPIVDCRKWTGESFSSAIQIWGDRVQQTGVAPKALPRVTNVTVENVAAIGTKQLPLMLNGIRGQVVVRDCMFERCKDIGFVFTESVLFTRNVIRWSVDNGVSFSRGTGRVVCTGNDIIGSYFAGIWIGGYVGNEDDQNDDKYVSLPDYAGPRDVIVTGNTVTHSGMYGIYAYRAPARATIAGNTIATVYRRGAADEERDKIAGTGIFIGGLPDDEPGWASDIAITGNAISNVRAGGMLIYPFSRSLSILDNRISGIGRTTYSDGTPIERSEGTPRNFGIYLSSWATAPPGSAPNRIVVRGNTMEPAVGAALLDGVFVHRYCSASVVADNTVRGTVSAVEALTVPHRSYDTTPRTGDLQLDGAGNVIVRVDAVWKRVVAG